MKCSGHARVQQHSSLEMRENPNLLLLSFLIFMHKNFSTFSILSCHLNIPCQNELFLFDRICMKGDGFEMSSSFNLLYVNAIIVFNHYTNRCVPSILLESNWYYLSFLFWEYWNICSTCHHYPLDPISCLKLLSSSLVTAYVHLHAEKTSQMTDTQLTSSAHTGELCANISTCEYCPY